jgi:hypothetical protein
MRSLMLGLRVGPYYAPDWTESGSAVVVQRIGKRVKDLLYDKECILDPKSRPAH